MHPLNKCNRLRAGNCPIKAARSPPFLPSIMKTPIRSLIFVALIALSAAGPALAGDADFTLVNRTGYDLRTARRSLNLLFADWANRGVNMWTIDSGSIPLVAGTATYSLPTDTVDLMDQVVRTGTGTNQTDISITRISVSTYATIPNKQQQARPIQIVVNRLSPTPSVTVWPMPDSSQSYTLVYWRLRRIQDAGGGVNTMDVPFRFIPVLVAGLSYYLSMKIPGALERMSVLKAQYDEAWDLASTEDREKASDRFVPRQQFI